MLNPTARHYQMLATRFRSPAHVKTFRALHPNGPAGNVDTWPCFWPRTGPEGTVDMGFYAAELPRMLTIYRSTGSEFWEPYGLDEIENLVLSGQLRPHPLIAKVVAKC